MEEYDWVNIIPVLVGGCLSVHQKHMTNISTAISDLPPEQRAIRDKCFHPTGRFLEFKKEEIEQSIPSRFEQQVRKNPDRIAVKTRIDTFTYDELNKTANRVARKILMQSGQGEEPVALLLEHGASVIATILGVLKAGKFYLPLDPSYPKARLDSMLGDAQAELIITNHKNFTLARTLVQSERQLLNIDTIDASISSEDLGVAISPDSLVYVIYTSGSTGQPKGVVQNHRNVLHFTMTYTNDLHVCPDDRLALLSSCSFSGSVKPIYGALLNGAALLPFDLQEEGLAHLATWLNQEAVTVYTAVPTVFRHFVGTLTGKEQFPMLRIIKLVGELVSSRDVELYKKCFSTRCIFINAFGATETGTTRLYFVGKVTPINGSIVPVGYPVEDMEILLLDEGGKKVGTNRIGEITVKSRYLSPGFWRQPNLTRVTFLPESAGGGVYIYRTGDLGRMQADGSLEHHGRKDFQVKVRGIRIETGEVEMKLLDHAAIKEVTVVVREDQSGDNRIVAYFVTSSKPGPSIGELRGFLKKKLPDYMIPSAFVLLDTLPLTPTGKVDRKALPVPGNSRPELDTPYAAPRTTVEKELAQIWAEVLSLDEIGIHDNFFEVGGHSLLATQVISRVINTFKVELPIKSLFESPTVADMAVVITKNMAKKAGDEELARMLTELESISDEEAQRLLSNQSKRV
jgi:amino acid adenylation domain-containing protein